MRHHDSTVAQNEDLPRSSLSCQGQCRKDEEVIKWGHQKTGLIDVVQNASLETPEGLTRWVPGSLQVLTPIPTNFNNTRFFICTTSPCQKV